MEKAIRQTNIELQPLNGFKLEFIEPKGSLKSGGLYGYEVEIGFVDPETKGSATEILTNKNESLAVLAHQLAQDIYNRDSDFKSDQLIISSASGTRPDLSDSQIEFLKHFSENLMEIQLENRKISPKEILANASKYLDSAKNYGKVAISALTVSATSSISFSIFGDYKSSFITLLAGLIVGGSAMIKRKIDFDLYDAAVDILEVEND